MANSAAEKVDGELVGGVVAEGGEGRRGGLVRGLAMRAACAGAGAEAEEAGSW